MNQDGGKKDTNTTTMTTTSRIAFGSCHKSEKSTTPPIWETILPPDPVYNDNDNSNNNYGIDTDAMNVESKLDAWLWLGDAMYPSHRNPVTNKKYYGSAPPAEVEAGLRAMKHENATIGYKGFLDRLNRYYHHSSSDDDDDGRPLVTGVWDDHDFGGNDMGYKMPEKKRRQTIYRAFLGKEHNEDGGLTAVEEDHYGGGIGNNNKADDRKEQEDSYSSRDGMYHRVDMEGGKIRILVLDTRWFREDHCIPSIAHKIPLGNAVACLSRWLTSGLLLHKYAWLWGKDGCRNAKVLGDDQWAWLENELLVESSSLQSSSSSSSSTAKVDHPPELFVILSSIQVWSTNPIMEGWGHFPKEQERLWNLLRTHYGATSPAANDGDPDAVPPAPVLFLSGDVHHAEISGQPGYYEVTSSGMTHHCGQHKFYGPVCEPILNIFSDHRSGAPQSRNGEEVKDGGKDNGDGNEALDMNGKDRYYIGLNYGLLEIFTGNNGEDGSKREVRAQIKNATGHTVLEISQALAGHGPIPILPPYDRLAHAWDGHLIPYARGFLLLAMIGLASIRALLKPR
mmetsp:Transcript_13025/g.27385  ORF Transcript_13025/g.27385 Transcript_13025/m.27385 type:complete len:565 (+) Transcript_13025:97-1791(+)